MRRTASSAYVPVAEPIHEEEEWNPPPTPSITPGGQRLPGRRLRPSGGSTDSNVYARFVQRYRSHRNEEDSRHDDEVADSHYFLAVEEEDEDSGPTSAGIHAAATSVYVDDPEPVTLEERERLEWLTMLEKVLSGDVLRSEKTRLSVSQSTSGNERNNHHLDIWLEVRAHYRGRTPKEERMQLEEVRLRNVDAIISEVMAFRAQPDEGQETVSVTVAKRQVDLILSKLDMIQALYPNLKSLCDAKPVCAENVFQARCDALVTWSNIRQSLRVQFDTLKKWIGSDTLDVEEHTKTTEISVQSPGRSYLNHNRTNNEPASFVERVLKDDNLQRTFENWALYVIHSIVSTARDAQINMAASFRELDLPSFEEDLVPIISFPTRLQEAALRMRLEYAKNLREPEPLILDQMTEDFEISIAFACTLKAEYEAIIANDPEGNWNMPSCIGNRYEQTILEALSFFFKLINWRLKIGVMSTHIRESEAIEAHWPMFNSVCENTERGASAVAEQLCALLSKNISRLINSFDMTVRHPLESQLHASARRSHVSQRKLANTDAYGETYTSIFSKLLEGVRHRSRMKQRLAQSFSAKFSNAAEYNIDTVPIDGFISLLVETDHFLVYTGTMEEEGTYVIATQTLRDRPDIIQRMLHRAYHAFDIFEGGYTDQIEPIEVTEEPDGTLVETETEGLAYLLVLSPSERFVWHGLVLMLDIPKIDFELKDRRIRLIADGGDGRLTLCKQQFSDLFLSDNDGSPESTDTDQIVQHPLIVPAPSCLVEQMAHLPAVNREIRKMQRASNRLAETIVNAVPRIRDRLQDTPTALELLENWHLVASDHGQRAEKLMDRAAWIRFNKLLTQLAVSWVAFICDDCDPTDRRIFRWAVYALEFALSRTRRSNILHIPESQFDLLRQKVASCMTLLISHFDILGARSSIEAKKEREKLEELQQQRSRRGSPNATNGYILLDSSAVSKGLDYLRGASINEETRIVELRNRVEAALAEVDSHRAEFMNEARIAGRVLDEQVPEDQSLMFLASSSTNMNIRWQQGRFIGQGAFGSVYMALNLESGSSMAVKEIRFHELAGTPGLLKQIKDELSVMELLHHENIVEYYGIEVHRDKVYIFEEFCEGGSLAALLENGRIEDETMVQLNAMQMLEGLNYLHSKGIVHRDVKPDNILLNRLGVIKFVDFGAAKVIARTTKTFQRSRVHQTRGGQGGKNSLTGTPMYMSPEVIKDSSQGKLGAMDVWSLGCVVLECATGRRPWSNLNADNEWAIMFKIGAATQPPPLPDASELSPSGIDFIRQCLTLDAYRRPTAGELLDHPWMVDCREMLSSYEELDYPGASGSVNGGTGVPSLSSTIAGSGSISIDGDKVHSALGEGAALVRQIAAVNLQDAGMPISSDSLPSSAAVSPGSSAGTDAVTPL